MSNKHDANVRKSTLVNFQIGLIASLLLVYVGFEVYTTARVVYPTPISGEIEEEHDYSMHDFEIKKEPVKKELAVKKKTGTPDRFIEKEDDVKLSSIEKEFVNTKEVETSTAPVIDEIDDLKDEEVIKPFDFTKVEDVPVFPGCEKLGTNKEKAVCFSEKIRKIVSRKFNTGLGARYGLRGTQRIFTLFEVAKDGTIQNIRVRAHHPKLEEEARRVIGLFPQMTPGKQRGTAVVVKYQLPITFRIQE